MRILKFASLVFAALMIFGFTRTAEAQVSRPDLEMQKITVSPLQPAVGQRVTITIQAVYHGLVPLYQSDSLTSKHLLIGDLSIDAGAGSILSITPSQATPLNDGQTFTYTYVGLFPTPGVKDILLDIDYDNILQEQIENNNKISTQITVWNLYDLPDLTLQSVAVSPDNPQKGSDTTLTVTGKYTGPEPLKSRQGIGTMNATLPDFVQSGEPVLAPVPIADQPLASGSGFTYTYHGSFTASGAKNLLFVTDSAGELIESNESNNSIAATVSIAEAEQPTPPEPQTPAVPATSTPPVILPAPSGNADLDALRERLARLHLTITDVERSVIADERARNVAVQTALVNRLLGQILLQVEKQGQAWYLDPISRLRYYLKDGVTAYQALQAFGLGISGKDLAKIPVGIDSRAAGTDSDGDGLIDLLENALGTKADQADSDGNGANDKAEVLAGSNPSGTGTTSYDTALTQRLEGRILLQVEGQGQAWYVHNGRRYYMPDGEQAYQIMRYLSLGITNKDLTGIPVGSFE
ncbi:MAG: hypothetical protein A2677_00025 [Candidatus Komeilibacteria bacterium RIFCSPHIGHO2_01_FULL_52_14]|uniref:CARDB domain-containing protein n=1 Tax=Candidatus Komeilibacteria bacterium RIFCSPHIGHO2_01_FULL_52_14 TaxID=1798549 RepID=A0A1G2BQ00_9BACT|nr:MAG: hypothetical protein A2677_00025 [Candidatus Komeilibacteria bacterium RIFCSPHIGHO2_01_FULL_52_14]